MKNPLEIKYCPRCKKEVAVVNNGNPKGKHSYRCKVCGRQFSERKYPIEVRCLAVKFRDFGYSFRDIARIFGIKNSPNTIRNWTLSKPEYDIEYQEQIQILKVYKKICDELAELKEKFEQCEKALEYHKFAKRLKELDDEYLKPNHNSTELWKILCNKQQVLDEMSALGKVEYEDYSIKKIRELQSAINSPIDELEKTKNEMETQTVFARDTYNMSEIINVLERLIGND